jgi:hypothetical protein
LSLSKEKVIKMLGLNSHLEHAETGLETLNNGVSAPLGPDRCIANSKKVPIQSSLKIGGFYIGGVIFNPFPRSPHLCG